MTATIAIQSLQIDQPQKQISMLHHAFGIAPDGWRIG
jgi:hypothetical protein